DGQYALYTSEWLPGTDEPAFTRGVVTGACNISYVVVEFAGSNWADVERVEQAMNAVGTALTQQVSIAAVSNAFLHVQGRSLTDGTDEMGAEVWVSSTNTVSFLQQSGNVSNLTCVAWLIENAGMNVQHIGGIRSGGTEPDEWTESITPVADKNHTSIMGETAWSAGGGDVSPRGSINLQLTAADEVTLWRSESNQDQQYRFSVVEWPLPAEAPFDSDGDGMPDTWEDLYGLNSSSNDAAGDADGDGQSNLNEYYAGTAPDDTNSIFKIIKHSGHGVDEFGSLIQALSSGAEIKLMWLGGTNGSTNDYIIYRSTSLVDGAWGQVTNYPRTNASGTNVWIDTEVSNDWLNIFYKITAPTN
ncbi:hypothetical protein ACFLS1_12005, partial [Verrucomicrobiota bacterium]